jgi:purine-binding chemotaxis protein CheW
MKYLCFRVGDEWYGIDVTQVIEVLHFVALHHIPGSRPEILGLLTLREVTMPVIDMRLRFQADSADLSLDTPIIATHTPHGIVGLVVDDVDDVEEIFNISDHHAHESPFINGSSRVGDRLVLIVDISQFRENELLQA